MVLSQKSCWTCIRGSDSECFPNHLLFNWQLFNFEYRSQNWPERFLESMNSYSKLVRRYWYCQSHLHHSKTRFRLGWNKIKGLRVSECHQPEEKEIIHNSPNNLQCTQTTNDINTISIDHCSMTITRLLKISDFGPFFGCRWQFVLGDSWAARAIASSTND